MAAVTARSLCCCAANRAEPLHPPATRHQTVTPPRAPRAKRCLAVAQQPWEYARSEASAQKNAGQTMQAAPLDGVLRWRFALAHSAILAVRFYQSERQRKSLQMVDRRDEMIGALRATLLASQRHRKGALPMAETPDSCLFLGTNRQVWMTGSVADDLLNGC